MKSVMDTYKTIAKEEDGNEESKRGEEGEVV